MKFKIGDIVRHINDNDDRWKYRVEENYQDYLTLSIYDCPPASDLLGGFWICHSKHLYLVEKKQKNHPHTNIFK